MLPLTDSGSRCYQVVAIEITIYFNKYGDHNHNGLMFTLKQNLPILKYIKQLMQGPVAEAQLIAEARARAQQLGIELPQTPEEAKQPHPLVRPLVLRACKGDVVEVQLENEIRDRSIGLHLVGDGYDIQTSDGAQVGRNASSLVATGETRKYIWHCKHEGVFPFHDAGNFSGNQDGTNAHGLFGALIVEPENAWWSDPEVGMDGLLEDGLYADVHLRSRAELSQSPKKSFPKTGDRFSQPSKYADDNASFREYVIFFHDEPEFVPPHGKLEKNPCQSDDHGENGQVGHGGHGVDAHSGSLMPISYRAEPMISRERIIWQKRREGTLNAPVLNEEQHHSSWMFGDPATPILRAYLGDPVRIRLVHAGVKETHVFHLHLYAWHVVPHNPQTPLIDAISISPQTGHTIVPLWGAGNRQGVPGDVIWHCHLYPHFHMGMWGIFRTFDTRQDGMDGDCLTDEDGRYQGRRIGRYPDGIPIAKLAVLPDREPPPTPTPDRPGFPLFIPGTVGQKSPRPPYPGDFATMPAELDYEEATVLERNAFNADPRPGELFGRFPYPRELPQPNHEIGVVKRRIDYNDDGWYDPDGHLYYLKAEGDPDERDRAKEPLFFRCRQQDVLELTLHNQLPDCIEETPFDPAFPPCDKLPWEGECGLHVHMVKFDPICGDGASTGWNYLSAPRLGKKMVYRWWADEEFGTIFFHDHLFANYRQKHGLFGALIVEPEGATFHNPFDSSQPILSGQQAVIKLPQPIDGVQEFREFCISVADWIPMFDRKGQPIEPPDQPGSHDDNGVMAVNYRSTPLRERQDEPAYWFHSLKVKEPDTSIFHTLPNEPIWIRLVQGSHEEQHSFQVHGMRWRRFRNDSRSLLVNQQTLGISEAFTFKVQESYGAGDYLWKFAGADDLWVGCWGLIRSYDPAQLDEVGQKLTPIAPITDPPLPTPPEPRLRRRFKVVAEARSLTYRDSNLVDPFGLIYRLDAIATPGATEWQPVSASAQPEPLVLRCRAGEWVEIELHNRLPASLRPEPFSPGVLADVDDRRVSNQVSLHADLLRYDVQQHDGANVGKNPIQSISPGQRYTYLWYADQVGAVLLQDMADVRNHRRHGLIGALIVEPPSATPRFVPPGKPTAPLFSPTAWHGARATIRGQYGDRYEEVVLLLQDGLRLFVDGDRDAPFPDKPEDFSRAGDPDVLVDNAEDTEDQGNKGFNYRVEPLLDATRVNLANPATPVWIVPRRRAVHFHLICAADRPRNHSFTIHGHTWREWRYMGEGSPRVASEAALSCGTVRTYELETANRAGDYMYRSGVLKWAVAQGLWGILRIARTPYLLSLFNITFPDHQ
ncbi:multicopper oxidase domain-containing protein [Leptolyngbya sp. FACHB-711]|uniref:multicopper oxidase domain-containing protein n=1 Tax=unclassified Leptolyngbya TaxID=2650499 RepID=UPI001687F4B5|nr:multicopper oxidase domain-containing protein [Leptolyngbya sp. FACHB-711]MBD1852804.1 multicopper oxidase domain-containing protein [Cyanobacteria bacterium FACHB-502]MBD2025210.1 multicopper oxidase domain-containing protein [Leptolyngbya sp. FACHB-711]